MTRSEFEDGLRALGYVANHEHERWDRPADALNPRARVAFDALDSFCRVLGYSEALVELRNQLEGPSAVDQLADVVRTDDDAGEVLGLVLGAL